jgi:hypothetical protein
LREGVVGIVRVECEDAVVDGLGALDDGLCELDGGELFRGECVGQRGDG